MNRTWILPTTVMSLLFFAQPACSQSKEFWPEVDVYVNVHERARLYFSAAVTSEQVDLGVSIDFHVKPLRKLMTGHSDQSKSSLLLMRAGYHYLPSKSGSTEKRVVLEVIGRYPLTAGLVGSLRSRGELRFIDGESSQRYRFRPGIERSFAITRAYQITPYARAEFYRDSNYKKWSRTALTAGCVFPIKKRSEIEAYFEHQNRTETSPNKQVNAMGLQLNFYFR